MDLIWSTVQWVMLVVCAFGACALLYYYGPDARRPIRAVAPGALAATLAWLVFSVGFARVLDAFGAFLVDPPYGWFAGMIVLMLYLYWSASGSGAKDRREAIGGVPWAGNGERGRVDPDAAVHGER
jgi:uncharacterized BrkB/YihY/UPF0761 family membrane protein